MTIRSVRGAPPSGDGDAARVGEDVGRRGTIQDGQRSAFAELRTARCCAIELQQAHVRLVGGRTAPDHRDQDDALSGEVARARGRPGPEEVRAPRGRAGAHEEALCVGERREGLVGVRRPVHVDLAPAVELDLAHRDRGAIDARGEQVVVRAADILKRDDAKNSGMPSSFIYTLSDKDVADLTAWIMSLQ